MKTYTILIHNSTSGSTRKDTGTLQELIEHFKYTLEVGKSWQHEKGNKKIDMSPKSIKSLVKNLNNAKQNAAANGYSNISYELGE
ncbi:MAG: hypothetical protein PHC28_15725 [Flavobacterium sp.]|uniref:hypothetical protein n=1 Tax=Flavobacterium sp. TaxID=239 RepID=UPI0026068298|nr:hypothetical protein [Flavobacterium sp.]MDD5151903.1 hypothetical protein [Flavobacterium sp.]